MNIMLTSDCWCFSVSQEPYDTDKMSEVFIEQFCNRAFSNGQPVRTSMHCFHVEFFLKELLIWRINFCLLQFVFTYGDKKYLQLIVQKMDGIVLLTLHPN